jgi:isopenicillin-N epimerase
MSFDAKSARALFALDADGAFLNHGSYGAPPREVLAAQSGWRAHIERQPDVFFRRELNALLRERAVLAGRRLGAEGRQIAFTANATEATNAVLRWFPLAQGDEVLVTSHGYAAVERNVRAVTGAAGAKIVIAPIAHPARMDQIVESVLGAVTPGTKLAILDSVTSPTAVRLPLDRIVPALKAKNIRVLIDAAHGIGLIPLDCGTLGADWVTTNAHKWGYAPRGTALLYAADTVAAETFPLAVSHYHAQAFPDAFDYTGTRDASGWLALDTALPFLARMSDGGAPAHMSAWAEEAGAALARFGAEPAQADGAQTPMRAYVLPTQRAASSDDPPAFLRALWDRHRVQIAANAIEGRLYLRLSPQVYTHRDDIAALTRALDEAGWPGR